MVRHAGAAEGARACAGAGGQVAGELPSPASPAVGFPGASGAALLLPRGTVGTAAPGAPPKPQAPSPQLLQPIHPRPVSRLTCGLPRALRMRTPPPPGSAQPGRGHPEGDQPAAGDGLTQQSHPGGRRPRPPDEPAGSRVRTPSTGGHCGGPRSLVGPGGRPSRPLIPFCIPAAAPAVACHFFPDVFIQERCK